MKKLAALLGLFLFVVCVSVPSTAQAMVFRTGDEVVVQDTESLSDSLFAAGQHVTINGAVRGDVFCAGQTVVIRGNVTGDVLCAAQSLVISGSVDGDVRAAGQFVDVEGLIGRNMSLFGQDLNISSVSEVNGELLFAAQEVALAGNILGDTSGAAQSVRILGQVGGDVDVDAVSLQLGPAASVSGQLSYFSENPLQESSSSAVAGGVVTRPGRIKRPMSAGEFSLPSGVKTGLKLMQTLFKLIAYALVGIMWVVLFRNKSTLTLSYMSTRPGMSFAWGLGSLLLFPTAFLVLILTIIGIPLAFTLVIVVGFLLVSARVLAGVFVGSWVLRRIGHADPSLFASLAVGLVVTAILFSVPFIGALASFILTVTGLGGLLMSLPPQRTPAPAVHPAAHKPSRKNSRTKK